MSQRKASLQIGDIARADFRTAFAVDAENSRIQKSLDLPYRYQPARLAISLSLRQPDPPKPIADVGGRPIRGDTLFGQDEADLTMWIALIVEHSGTAGLSRKEFQDIVAAHWARGMKPLSASMNKNASIEGMFGLLMADAASQ